MDYQEKHSRRPRKDRSIYYKSGFIVLLTLFLMIPSAFIQELIRERQNNSKFLQRDISQSWGNAQLISGPILVIPYQLEYLDSGGKSYLTDHKYYVTPQNLQIDARVDSEIRKKSIYEAILYTNDFESSGTYDLQKIREIEVASIEWDKAYFVMGISNPTAISESVNLKWDGVAVPVSPGTEHHELMEKGIHAKVVVPDGESVTFTMSMKLRGSHYLYFEPVAKNSIINMQSDWSSPGFVGNLLADKREVTEKGFTATWKISEFNRTVPDFWSDYKYKLGKGSNSFGVDFINPVNHYQKNMRSAKYAMLIIALTFMSFFFFEVLYKKKVHPIQYGFIGISLVLFYYLLLSITEHLGFSVAYIIASSATILLIIAYSITLLKSRKSVFTLSVILGLLYSYIFVLLQLEEYALVTGSIGLFIILAGVMYLSRNVDWYNVGNTTDGISQEVMA